jgi:hypothetical protein
MKQEIVNFIKNGGNFEETALRLWRWQVERNSEYGRFCGVSRPNTWQNIPAVPVALFRDLNLTCFPPFLASVAFRTSGTTGPRGIHRLQDTEVYDLGSLIAMQRIIGSVPQDGVSLVSPSFDSSLGHMCRSFAPKLLQCFLTDVGVLAVDAWNALHQATTPIFLPSTGFAMVSLLEKATHPCLLPKGSIIMVTGGLKGKHTEVNEQDLYAKLCSMFPTASIVAEYGMTELSSQLWSTKLGKPFHPPPWMKVVAVDPKTGSPANGIGILKFVDLANHQTVLAIETRDLGEVLTDGSVVLHGRAPQAEPRGCSLSVEEVDQFFTQPTVVNPSPKAVIQTRQKTDHNYAEKVYAALQQLLPIQAEAISQNLSAANAQFLWQQSINQITIEGLQQTLSISDYRPHNISIIAAQGVFTSPVEWIAIALASGASVHVKSPKATPQAIALVCNHFASLGFPITHSIDRILPSSELVFAFGEDETIASIKTKHPNSIVRGYGHKFSVAVCSGTEQQAKDIARSIAAYDGRGCMAPVAIFCTKDATQFHGFLSSAMAEIQQKYPLGAIDPFLGPEIRRQVGLANVKGKMQQGEGWKVLSLPSSLFTPFSLPRMPVIHPVSNYTEIERVLLPWKDHLSILGCNQPSGLDHLFHRRCPLAQMQNPILPREHDGKPMWITDDEFT